MKVSVIVPAYNEEKFLAKTLKSLTSQTFKDYELIVIDNNSKDKTSQIAKEFMSKVFLETQKGYIHAVMRGARESVGELITFCDADSVYPSIWLEQVVKEFNKHPEAVAVYGSCYTHDANAVSNFINSFFYTLFLRGSRFFGMDNTSGFNFVMKRQTFFEVGGYNPKYQKMSPDIELGKRLKAKGKIIFNSKIKVGSSFRRFKDGGTIKTTLFFLKSWWAMVIGKEPTVTYEEYNKDIR